MRRLNNKMLGSDQTIVALGTAQGVGALSIIRISGLKTPQIIQKCFVNNSFDPLKSQKFYFGHWSKSDQGEPIDQVIVLYFPEGKSYTGEQSADVICHGGSQVAKLIVSSVLDSGARLAKPGEFTLRAVMNDKLDLAKAESVLALINAKSPQAAALALQNLDGALSKKLGEIENDIIYLLSHLEATIDFTTEDIQPVAFSEMKIRLQRVFGEIEKLLSTFIPAQVASLGLRVALVGKPNAGKSSLLNALTGKNRSIVSSLPGTTRDTIEIEALIGGTLFKFIDTAGLHEATSELENLGISRTQKEIKSADLVVYVVDSTVGILNEDSKTIAEIGKERAVICFNKNDLKKIEMTDEITRFGLHDFQSAASSAVINQGTETLIEMLTKKTGALQNSEMNSVLTTERQKEALSKASEFLSQGARLLEKEESPDLIAFELKQSLNYVQSILGKKVDDEEVLEKIFKEFCIGK